MVLRFVKRFTALVEAKKNTFVNGRPISREEEKRGLVADVLSGQTVMMHLLQEGAVGRNWCAW